MSNEGKLRRGEKWFRMRDIDGNLPKEILNDQMKMCDVNFYINSIEPKEEEVKKKKKGV